MYRLNLTTTPLETALNEAVAVLRAGGLVIYPTETTYGIGGDATNPAAIKKLYRYKSQRSGKPFSVVVTDQTMAEKYVELNDTARTVYKTFLPGPVTVVSVGKHVLTPGVESESGTVGIRIPAHPIPLALVEKLGHPITATSANASNQKRPYQIEDILTNTSAAQQSCVDLVLDAGLLPPNEPSTVIDTTLESLQVLRHGATVFPEDQQIVSHSVEETQALGQRLIRSWKSFWGEIPILFALSGEMGVGKTHFTQGVAAELGITKSVKSPSYTLAHEYSVTAGGNTFPFVHIDAWRLENPAEVETLGVSDAFAHNGVVCLEWASLTPETLQRWQNKAVIVSVESVYGEAENDRHIRWSISQPDSFLTTAPETA